MQRVLAGLLLAGLVILAGCGGSGGGGSVPQPRPSPTQSPDPFDLDHAQPGKTAVPIVFPSPAAPSPAPMNGSAPYDTIVIADTPAAYFRLGEQGTTAADSSGNGLSAVYHTQGTTLTRSSGLLVNNAHFSTANAGAGYVASARLPSLENPTVSIEAWYAPANLSAYQSIAEYGDNTAATFTGYGLKYDAHNQAFAFKLAVAGGQHAFAIVEPTSGPGYHPLAGKTYYLAGTYDGTTANLYVNGVLAASQSLSGPITYAAPTANAGLTFFNDPLQLAPATGSLQETAVYASALPAATVQSHFEAGATAYTDWTTFGYDLARTGNNPAETTLGASNAAQLRLLWKTDLGGAIDAQPVLATAVNVTHGVLNLLYVGAENGMFYALNTETGRPVWQAQLGSETSTCGDIQGGLFGITGTAAIDRARNRVYVADGQNQIHAFDMSTGQEAPGYPVALGNVAQEHIYSALTYNAANDILYAATASYCDDTPYDGRLVAIDAASGTVAATFMPVTSTSGGGMWGMGGVSINTTDNDVFVATGNPPSQYGESLVRLSAALAVSVSNRPAIISGDYDFGSTPLLVQTPGCAAQVILKNKNGQLMTWNRDAIGSGAVQQLQMAYSTQAGSFVGEPAYSAATNLLYVGDPSGSGSFNFGLVALREQPDCTWALAWQQNVGAYNTVDNNDPPSVANGVVYYNDGLGNESFAFNAAAGTALWNSGTTITGPIFAAPTIDGHLFIASWDHHLYTFAP